VSAFVWVGHFANLFFTLVLLALPLIAVPALVWVGRSARAIYQKPEAADAH
jgi:hypothetical protein